MINFNFFKYLISSLFFIIIFNSVNAQNCDCTEYIYLNEPGSSSVHKYSVNADGSLTEVALPAWYDGTELINPHGLALDLNGNVYVGEDFEENNDIRKLTCDGQILPESEFAITSSGQFNIGSIGNSIFFNARAGNEENILQYDVCSQQLISGVQFCEFPGNFGDWGFYIDPQTNEMYATSGLLSDTSPNYFWYFTPSDFDNDPNTCVTAVPLSADFPVTNANVRGVVSDADGNVYIAVQADAQGSYILKYGPAPTFTYLGTTGFDNADDGTGWSLVIGMVYSETANLIYASTEAFTDDCVSVFDTDLNYLGVGVPNPLNGNRAKGIANIIECCPNEPLQTLQTEICVPSIPYETNINALYQCDATICEGPWELDNSVANVSFDACRQDITYLEEGCATFTKVSDGSGKKQCGAFNITLTVCVFEATITLPAISVTDNDCAANISGSFNVVTDCGADATLEWSTDGANWSTTMPVYDEVNVVTVRARCVNNALGCTSLESVSLTTDPDGECCPPVNCINQFGEFTITKRRP